MHNTHCLLYLLLWSSYEVHLLMIDVGPVYLS